MEPYIVLTDKQVNGRRDGLAFSALPDAPVLAPTAPGVLRRQVTRIANWSRSAAADRPNRPSTPRHAVPCGSVSPVVPAGRRSATRMG
jgi:hypothetical protein